LHADNPSSVRSCLAAARDNARAARNALSREAWEAINRAWLTIRSRASPGGSQATLTMVDALRADTRGFEGALMRMLRSEGYWFVRLGPDDRACRQHGAPARRQYYLCCRPASRSAARSTATVEHHPPHRLRALA
jgi:hypothetical protein